MNQMASYWDYREPTASRQMGFLFEPMAYLSWTIN